MDIQKLKSILLILILLLLIGIYTVVNILNDKLLLISGIELLLILLSCVFQYIYRNKTVFASLSLSLFIIFIFTFSIELQVFKVSSVSDYTSLNFWLIVLIVITSIISIYIINSLRKRINHKLNFSFHWQVLSAMAFGIIFGVILPYISISIGFIGDLFIKVLQMLVAPLVLTSIFMGIAQLGNIKSLGSLGWKTIIFYLSTTIIAILIGVMWVYIIEPGHNLDSNILLNQLGFDNTHDIMDKVKEQPNTVTSFIELQLSKIFTNIFSALSSNNMLAIIFFSILLAVSILSIGEKGKIVIKFFDGFNEALLKIIRWVMITAPIGIFALIGKVIAQFGWKILEVLASYALTVTVSLSTHALIILPLIIILVARYNIIKFFTGVFSAIITAFSTASSTATLPISLKCAREQLSISPKLSDFVIPLGATVNMNGTALYEAVAAIFIAQLYGIELDFAKQLIIVITATLAAIGAAGIPHAGLVTMVIIFNAVGLPIEGIMLIVAVDRILDMMRTSVNVYGDLTAAVTLNRLHKFQ